MSNFNRLSPVIFLALFSYLISAANLLASAGACTAILKVNGSERSLALDGLAIALAQKGYQLQTQKQSLSGLSEIRYESQCHWGCWRNGSYTDSIDYSTNLNLTDSTGNNTFKSFRFSYSQHRNGTWASRRPLFVNGFIKGVSEANIQNCK